MKKTLIALTVFLLGMHSARGQFIADINPANTGDPRFIFANPAIPDLGAAPYIVAGYQRLYTGLPLLSNRIIGLVLPTARWGRFALSAPGFQSPHFNQSALELRYAYTFANLRTTLGFNAGTMLTSFNRNKFQLVDANDPLLLGNQSLNVFNIGIGATVKAIDKLTFGVSADHLNRPRVSFEGGMRRGQHLQAGAMFERGMFKPMAMWEREDGETYWSFGGEAWLRNISVLDALMARAFYRSEYFSFGGGLLYENLRFDCLYDLPIRGLSAVTNGSYQFVMTYNFQKEPCNIPPSPFVKADRDTIYLAPHGVSLPKKVGDQLDWKTLNLFAKDGEIYEILNPQANPFVNYAFFRKNSSQLAGANRMLGGLIRFANGLGQENGRVRLTGRINRGDRCIHLNSCEQQPLLAKERETRITTLLYNNGMKNKVTYSEGKNPWFDKCIEKIDSLKDERQRVDIQIIKKNGEPQAWPYSFASKDTASTECNFDMHLTKAPCPSNRWFFGVWRADDETQPPLLAKVEKSSIPEKRNWPIKPGTVADIHQNQWIYYQLGIEDNISGTTVSPLDSIFIVARPPRPTRLLVLFNFDSYTELLGDAALTPEGRDTTFNYYKGENCDSLLHSIDKYLGQMLDASLKPLQEATNITIEKIVGYTDSFGDAEYNLELSEYRAKLVKCYLMKEFELPISDVPAIGKGEADPLLPNLAPAAHWLNRRVEIYIQYK